MKVGIISKGSPDYLIDIVADGLIRLLGRQNVSLDYNARGGWGGQFVHLFKDFAGPEPFDIHDSDVLVASVRSETAMSEWMQKTGKNKVACIDGEDDPTLRNHIVPRVKAYFKREYLKGLACPGNVHPLPFAAIPEEVIENVPQRQYPVFYLGNPSHHDRLWVAGALTSMGFMPLNIRFEKAEYNKFLMGSMIGISARGGGWDTYRYWETPYFGAMLLSQRLDIVIPGDFVEGTEAVFYSGPDELKTKLRESLADPARTKKIADAGKAACRERHLSIHRAKTVLEKIS